jgi:hypothetical protein
MRGFAAFAASLLLALAGCTSPRSTEPEIDPDVARAGILRALPEKMANRNGWSIDLFATLEAMRIAPTPSNACAVIAVAEQESGLRVDPAVPGLPAIARREIDSRADRHGIPHLLVSAALELHSPNGKTYRERLDKVSTEKDLSDIFTDFIGMVPLGERLFGDLNPVHTGGPMQVSISFAENYAKSHRYPYPMTGSVRDEVFTRRGGLYFGTAHLLDYPVAYDDMLYRFADFNAGHYASRNAAFQNAVSIVSGVKLALDGDLLLHGSAASQPSKTELAVRKIAAKVDLGESQIRSDLEHGEDESFVKTRVYERVFELARKARPRGGVPAATVPKIKLESPKITRQLTTEWFARRVKERYEKCLARAGLSQASS